MSHAFFVGLHVEDVESNSGHRDSCAAVATMPLFQTQPPEQFVLPWREHGASSGHRSSTAGENGVARKLSASSRAASNVSGHQAVKPSSALTQNGHQIIFCFT